MKGFDAMDEVEILLKQERRRQGRERAGAALLASGLMIGGLTTMLDEADFISKATSNSGFTAAVIIALAGVAVALRWRPRSDARRLEALIGRRDRLQRSLNDRIYAMSMSGWGLVAASLPALWRVVDGRADARDLAFVVVASLVPWLVLMSVIGWEGFAGKNSRWLEDEVTRDIRRRAFSLGFVLLLSGMACLFLLSLWRPPWASMAFPTVMMVASSAVGLRFVWLDRAAETGDG